MSNCPFCQLKPEQIIHQNEHAVVIRDGYPVSEGHSLIVTKRHIRSFFETTEQERMSLLALLDVAKANLDKSCQPASYNIGINDGEAAGQTVPHMHIHLIPRLFGDVEDPQGGVRGVIPRKQRYRD